MFKRQPVPTEKKLMELNYDHYVVKTR